MFGDVGRTPLGSIGDEWYEMNHTHIQILACPGNQIPVESNEAPNVKFENCFKVKFINWNLYEELQQVVLN